MVTQPLRAQQVEALADAGQHPQREHIDLHQPQRVDIVLVPFDERALRHRGVVDRDQFVQPSLSEHEPADVLRQVAGEAQQPLDQRGEARDFRVGGIEPGFGHALCAHRAVILAPDGGGQAGGDILGQAQRLAHFAHGAAGAVMDHRRGNPGALAAIAAIDVLDHFLAPLMLEIDVDVGRLVALFGQEAREQQLFAHRIDRGDPQQVADQRIGRAAAPLAQDRRIEAAGVADQVMDGQEIAGIAA